MALPAPRVRQIRAPESSSPRALILKVRAFDEWFDRGADLSALHLSGRVVGEQFIVELSHCPALPLLGSVHRDRSGPYALLEVQQHLLGNGLALRVEADAQDRDLDLASISCLELPDDKVAQLELCHAQRWYSVYFNPFGHSDGTGTGGPRNRHSSPPMA